MNYNPLVCHTDGVTQESPNLISDRPAVSYSRFLRESGSAVFRE